MERDVTQTEILLLHQRFGSDFEAPTLAAETGVVHHHHLIAHHANRAGRDLSEHACKQTKQRKLSNEKLKWMLQVVCS
jgi:hypothetical protein